ncbi:UDP-N-acetylglucosamine transferase subunit ALG13 [Bemisia tabaci]|uniref:UDP-N-acetylglucosamine transferase subunit ALG13 n=1 Tax=Bemisia tabaci TaxID=7038 RepID=UPI0008F9B50A|nr:PREDICTED: UDP-N-acetylglucosamine transferase subunit ALG13 homolog [Bemisia tabaci]
MTRSNTNKQVFITVGTTRFDSLIQQVCSSSVLSTLKSKGYSKVVLQIGNGSYEPKSVAFPGIKVEFFRFKNNLKEDISNSDLVISHAGAGSCLEVLEAKKPLIVVVNENLMGNHQVELAEKLYESGHLYYCTPNTLAFTLETSDLTKLVTYECGKPERFAHFLENLLGLDKSN